jgi:hypothetical protein
MRAATSHSIVKAIMSFDSLYRMVSDNFFGFEVHWIAKEPIVLCPDTFRMSCDAAMEILI